MMSLRRFLTGSRCAAALLFVMLAGLYSLTTYAASSATITVKATITIPPCVINSGNAVNVVFDDTEIDDINNDVNADKRSKQVTLTVSCPALSDLNALRFTMTGTAASAGNYVLSATGGTGVGIAMYKGETTTTTLPLNQAAVFSGLGSVSGTPAAGYAGTLTFTSLLVKASNSVPVKTGAFSAIATLVVIQA